MDQIILFKFPSRSRPEKFRVAMKSITDNMAQPDKARFMFTLDEDDPTLPQYNEVIDTFKFDYVSTVDKSDSKIHAVNRNLDQVDVLFPDWEILVCMSDDMMFIANGFDNIIREAFDTNFPNGDGVIHVNDGNQKANVMTMSIMDRKYFNRTKYIYNPEYISLWCDCEAMEVAHILGRLKYMGDNVNIVRHLHPAWGFCEFDEQYKKTEAPEMWSHDQGVINKRRANYYGIPQEERINGYYYERL